MALADFTECVDNLSGGNCKFIASGAFTKPPGGGSFNGAWKSLSAAIGNNARFYNGAGFAPTPKGGVISAALKRSVSAGPLSFAPYVFLCLQGTSSTFEAYILGLADGAPSHIVLRKGTLSSGLPDVDPGTQDVGVLWRSTEVVGIDEWAHLQLMAAINVDGDVVLSVWRNDLTAIGADVTTPDWVQVAGVNMLGASGSGITDDAAGINTGTASLSGGGNMGFGFYTAQVNRVGMVDAIAAVAQA